jgi:hypothetical protein
MPWTEFKSATATRASNEQAVPAPSPSRAIILGEKAGEKMQTWVLVVIVYSALVERFEWHYTPKHGS